MKKIIFIVLGLSIVMVSCKKSEKTVSTNTDSEETSNFNEPVITFEKTPCFGTCPTYKATIYKDGSLSYNGIRFVELVGEFKLNIGEEWVKDIQKMALDIKFFEMEEKYDGNVTDLPSTHTMITYKGKTNKVTARYNFPEELKELNLRIHNDIMALMKKNAETLKKNSALRESKKRSIEKRPAGPIPQQR